MTKRMKRCEKRVSDQVNTARRNRTVRKWYHWLKWGDLLLYLLILVAAIILLSGVFGIRTQAAAQAVITRDGETILQIPLDQLEETGEENVVANGYHYRITYENGRIRFAEADCPDQICVHTGWISRSGELAACVPGHLILRIEAENGQTADPDDLDVVIR